MSEHREGLNFKGQELWLMSSLFHSARTFRTVEHAVEYLLSVAVIKKPEKEDPAPELSEGLRTLYQETWLLDKIDDHVKFNVTIPALSMAQWNCPDDCLPYRSAPTASLRVALSASSSSSSTRGKICLAIGCFRGSAEESIQGNCLQQSRDSSHKRGLLACQYASYRSRRRRRVLSAIEMHHLCTLPACRRMMKDGKGARL